MSEGILHGDALVGVERQHLVEQVEGLGVCAGVELEPRHLGLDRQRLEVAPRLLASARITIEPEGSGTPFPCCGTPFLCEKKKATGAP